MHRYCTGSLFPDVNVNMGGSKWHTDGHILQILGVNSSFFLAVCARVYLSECACVLRVCCKGESESQE